MVLYVSVKTVKASDITEAPAKATHLQQTPDELTAALNLICCEFSATWNTAAI